MLCLKDYFFLSANYTVRCGRAGVSNLVFIDSRHLHYGVGM
jgi:hypothetical protein